MVAQDWNGLRRSMSGRQPSDPSVQISVSDLSDKGDPLQKTWLWPETGSTIPSKSVTIVRLLDSVGAASGYDPWADW